MLKGKTVLLGVTGGIAAYKAAALASALVKLHATVEVVMTVLAEKAGVRFTMIDYNEETGECDRTGCDAIDPDFTPALPPEPAPQPNPDEE